MSRDETSDLRKMNRRKALKMFGGSVAGIGGIYHIGEVRGSDYVEIPTVKNYGKVLESETVPREWYEHTRDIKRVLAENRQSLDKTGVVRTGLARSNEKYGGMNGSKIRISVDSEVGVEGKVPEEIDGFEVGVKEVSQKKPDKRQEVITAQDSWPCYNDVDASSIGGGLPISTVHGDNTAIATSGVAVSRPWSDTRYLISANHIFEPEGEDCTNTLGQDFSQYDENTPVGSVFNSYPFLDIAVLDSSGNNGSFSTTIENGSTSIIADGHYTDSGVEYLKSVSEEISNVGATTGESSGTIDETNIDGKREEDDYDEICYTYGEHGIRIECDMIASGDSGSPWFVQDPQYSGYVVMLTTRADGTNLGQVCGNKLASDACLGTGMYHFVNSSTWEVGLGVEKDP